MVWSVGVAIVVFGLVAGTLSAWIANSYQEHETEEIAVWTPAACASCAHELQPSELAPPMWWISHRGGCPSCGERLPTSWLALQLGVPAAMLVMLATFGTSLVLIPFLWLVPVLATAATTDIRLMLIPRRIAWIGAAVGGALIVAVSLATDQSGGIQRAAIGGIAYISFLFVVSIITPGGMGMGDVRLSLLLGLYLGWINVIMPAVGLFIACAIGTLMGLAVRFASKGEQRLFPFGPGLAAGTLIAIALYQPILERLPN